MLRKWSTIACSDQSQNAHCTINEPHKHYTFFQKICNDAYQGGSDGGETLFFFPELIFGPHGVR